MSAETPASPTAERSRGVGPWMLTLAPMFALFSRSLREDGRLKATYFTRIGLVMIILLFIGSVTSASGWSNAPGLRFFSTVVYINTCFIILAGMSHFSSAITEEKEEMTLGLLRMTNLNALSILLGKSTSRVVNALLMLLVQVPFTLLAISLGGVAMRQVAAAYFTLGAFLLFVANLALLASVVCRRSTGAAIATGATLFIFFAGVPFLRWVVMLPLRFGVTTTRSPLLEALNHAANAIAVASPFNRLANILGTGFSTAPAGGQVWSNLALAAGCFLLAWLLFEIFCNEQQEAAQPRSLIARRTSPFRLFGAGRVWNTALAWKDFHFLIGGKPWLLLRFVLYAIPSLIFCGVEWRFNQRIGWQAVSGFTVWIATLLAGAEMAFIAASVLRNERRWKTLSSLAMLPMSMRRIAYQKLLGCLPSLIPSAVYFVAGWVVMLHFSKTETWSMPPSGAITAICYAVAQSILFLHVTATLSLYLRRGALPAAIAIHFIWNLFVAIVMAAAREEAVMMFLTFVCLGLAAALHVHIGRRLETLAEEE